MIAIRSAAALSFFAAVQLGGSRIAAPLSEPDSVLSDRERAAHALNRLAFGPRPGEVDRVARLGVERWIENQLTPSRVPDPTLRAALEPYRSLTKSARDLIAEYPPPNVVRRERGNATTRADSVALRRQMLENRAFGGELVSARVSRAVATERQLEEVMADFWLNHFSVFLGKNQLIRYYLPGYEREVIRPRVLGDFRELLGAVAKSPAMLIYLDNVQSVADSSQPTLQGREGGDRRRRLLMRSRRLTDEQRELLEQAQTRRPRGLNENYARELLELHTLGVDGGYTQHDVIEVARALTGWTVAPARLARSEGFVFNPAAHDAGAKTVLGHQLAAGRGIDDGEDVLDIVARHPATALHLARKLAIRFVSDSPSSALVERAAATFTRTKGDIRKTVESIVMSPEFFSRASYRSKVKSPFEVVVSAVRALGGSPDSTLFSAGVVSRLGQPIYGHQAPDGWPETGAEWMNTGAILNRINFGMVVASNRLPGVTVSRWAPYGGLAGAPREQQVEGVIASVLAGSVSAETREILLTGTNPMMEAAAQVAPLTVDDAGVPAMNRPNAPARRAGGGARQDSTQGARRRNQNMANPRMAMQGVALAGNQNLAGLEQIIGLALGSPEFQRR